MAPGRKLPFSGKAKKEQLKLKRKKKQLENRGNKVNLALLQSDKKHDNSDESDEDISVTKLNQQPKSSRQGGRDVNRYALQFYKESKDDLEKRKKEAFNSLNTTDKSDLEIKCENYFPTGIDFPKRPKWTFNMSKEELEIKENKYFKEYVDDLEKRFGSRNLSYFELNLETWRQLWRVLEMSDIMLFIVDVRYSALMFPPSLYDYISEVLHKGMILVLNKIDLVPAGLVVAWKNYFLNRYPNLRVITFTSFPGYNLRSSSSKNKSGLQVRRRRGKLRMAAEGAKRLYEACKEIVQDQVDLCSWADKIADEMHNTFEDEELNIITEKVDTSYKEHVQYNSGTLTIGCIGQPNVGKSSLMNAIMGKKVVSVSRTPGHTKHFQTIYLTHNVIICDCPGLVFPSLIPRVIQILIGAYPIAQVREPYTAVKFLAERVDLPKLLKIRHPDNDDCWSAMDICDGWARLKGFFTAKAARPDLYRAANNILRMALEGKICLSFKPPGYFKEEEIWSTHSDVAEIEWIQAKEHIMKPTDSDEEVDSSDSSVEVSELCRKGSKLKMNVEEDIDEDDLSGETSDTMQKPKLVNKFEVLASSDN